MSSGGPHGSDRVGLRDREAAPVRALGERCMREEQPIIRFDRVWKHYEQPQAGLRVLVRRVTPGGSGAAADGPASRWALRDISFSLASGEALGIIGANGAGKSTLLKVIAGITAPTRGHVSVRGRVGPLIELGAGFNPNLTGRENIYLNAAVLGLRRQEVTARFDRIVDFSGLREYLEVPVKYYSSGMYARLGFAVAAHIDADILIADEVLAVGDALFQRQCLEKFRELTARSTILFVSHDLRRLTQVCTRVIWLHEGALVFDGEPGAAVEAYLGSVRERREEAAQRQVGPLPGAGRWGSREIEIVEVLTRDREGNTRAVFHAPEDVVICIRYRIHGPYRAPGFGIKLCTGDGLLIHGANTFIDSAEMRLTEPSGEICVTYEQLRLLTGTYWITVGAASDNNWKAPYDVREQVHRFEVITSRQESGVVSLDHKWSHGRDVCGTNHP